ncbi:MAG: 2-C-methyl-D-erythritol 2,4-cyclodiphosphate synthase [Dehalococcoidia bacterium]|nr:2-C-methyl-D-erythritol 2,4-cyclodiphosphate synthase [Dehalococcoidia bacterium]
MPGTKGLLGHSDADVLLHAVTDALLGAAALGDIGQHFPPGNPETTGISSLAILSYTRQLLSDSGWQIVNIDSTVVAESPKLAPYLETMRQRIGEVLGLTPDYISIKAKTNEGFEAVGRGEAISAYAVALVERLEQ